MRKYIIFFFMLFTLFRIPASSQCVKENKAFDIGEELYFYAYYNWGKLWIKAGKASFIVSEKDSNYVYTVEAANLPGWDWLYYLRTTHIASMTKEMKPVFLKAYTNEKGDISSDEYYYINNEIHKHFTNTTYPEGKDTVYPHTSCSWDIINAVYAARNFNFNDYEIGQDIPFYVNFSDKTHTIYGKIIKEEKIKNKEGEEFDCLKCTATVPPGTIFAANRPVYVWITNDERRLPILIECQIRIGSIKVYLYEYKKTPDNTTPN
jgi:hypothetical protein